MAVVLRAQPGVKLSPCLGSDPARLDTTDPVVAARLVTGSSSQGDPLSEDARAPQAVSSAPAVYVLGGECKFGVRTCFCSRCLARPPGNLGSLDRRGSSHVETGSPPRLFPLNIGPASCADAFLALDSSVSFRPGVSPGSFAREREAGEARDAIAAAHRPRFASLTTGSAPEIVTLVASALYDIVVDVLDETAGRAAVKPRLEPTEREWRSDTAPAAPSGGFPAPAKRSTEGCRIAKAQLSEIRALRKRWEALLLLLGAILVIGVAIFIYLLTQVESAKDAVFAGVEGLSTLATGGASLWLVARVKEIRKEHLRWDDLVTERCT